MKRPQSRIVLTMTLLLLGLSGTLDAQQPRRRNDPPPPAKAQETMDSAGDPRNPYLGALSRVKDLARLLGADENQLKGLGLVVGLKGTGDSKEAVQKALASTIMKLEHYQIREQDIISKNVAVVAVSAEIPPFQEAGTRIDVKVASLYDAKDLTGGQLILTPLRGPVVLRSADPATETVYATAQGSVYIGGGGPSPTAVIPRGAIVQRTIKQDTYYRGLFDNHPFIVLSLDAPDYSVANAIANAVAREEELIAPGLVAYALNAGAVKVEFPLTDEERKTDAGRIAALSRMISTVLEQTVEIVQGTEPEAVVVLNERSKTVAVSGKVIVAPGAVYKGANFKIEVPPAPAKASLANPGVPGPSGKVPPPAVSGGMLLTDILDLADFGGAKPEEVIDMVRAFDRAGLIFGRVVVE